MQEKLRVRMGPALVVFVLSMVAYILVATQSSRADTAHMTGFRPETNGFQFGNSYRNDFIPALDVRTDGLCGGMSYSALDYYFMHTNRPTQPFQPAVKTRLYNYLYDRQVTSITHNLDKWGEIGFNPGGARDAEFFNWGISAKKGERIDELRSFIDRGTPVVLGLQGDGSTGNHQVIAYGYDMGRYQGDLGAHLEDFKIFICDPNDPGESRTLVADRGRRLFTYVEDRSKTWRTYFVDKKYHAARPPVIANGHYPSDGLVHALILDFHTGGDDLRGGNDNVDVTVNLSDGTHQVYKNVNLGARWVVNCEQDAEIALSRPVPLGNISSLLVSTTSGGGFNGDNWDMASLDVYAWGGGFYKEVKSVGARRFTGSDRNLVIGLNPVARSTFGPDTSKPSMLEKTVTVKVDRIGLASNKGPRRSAGRIYPQVKILDDTYADAGRSPRSFSRSVAGQSGTIPIRIEIWQKLPEVSGSGRPGGGPAGVHARTILRTIDVRYSLRTHRFTAREGAKSSRFDLKVAPVRGQAGTDVLFPSSGPAPEVLFSVRDDATTSHR